MSRKKKDDDQAFGSDSFLDVIANMVGILIILVMIAGLRAKQIAHIKPEHDPKAQAEITALNEEAQAIEREVLQLANEAAGLKELTAARHAERDSLGFLVAAWKHEIDERREKLDGKSREEYDLRRALSEAQADLDRKKLELTRKALIKPVAATKIETYPTPISHTVTGRELHFQLRHGRVAFVPMDELTKSFEEHARQRIEMLRSRNHVTETVGPIGDFRLRYTLEVTEVPGGRGGMVQARFTLIPVSSQLGEPVEQALGEHSDFRDVLQNANPRQTTVTLWTYQDSFAAYRAIKKDLYGRGYAVAGRPLQEGQPIGAATNGTKSAAQ
jgi:hypothetical protein